mmetsp:Transcript_133864/g.299226  ORF Transcript_133864/g.299226 Transcript_133864/m.299226 type:complete len:222 (-) Transcript_133864:359-1024(-)
MAADEDLDRSIHCLIFGHILALAGPTLALLMINRRLAPLEIDGDALLIALVDALRDTVGDALGDTLAGAIRHAIGEAAHHSRIEAEAALAAARVLRDLRASGAARRIVQTKLRASCTVGALRGGVKGGFLQGIEASGRGPREGVSHGHEATPGRRCTKRRHIPVREEDGAAVLLRRVVGRLLAAQRDLHTCGRCFLGGYCRHTLHRYWLHGEGHNRVRPGH